jgi:hypothetical protein
MPREQKVGWGSQAGLHMAGHDNLKTQQIIQRCDKIKRKTTVKSQKYTNDEI